MNVLKIENNRSQSRVQLFSNRSQTRKHMFSKLLKSEARKSLLTIFLNESRQKYYLRELAERIKYSPGSLQRELNSLVDDGLLLSEKMGNLRFFSLNTKSSLLKELRQYLGTQGAMPPLKATQSKAKSPKPHTHPATHAPTQPVIRPPIHPTTQIPIQQKTQVSTLEKPEIKKPIFSKPDLNIPKTTYDYPDQKSSMAPYSTPKYEPPSFTYAPTPRDPDSPPDDITLHIE